MATESQQSQVSESSSHLLHSFGLCCSRRYFSPSSPPSSSPSPGEGTASAEPPRGRPVQSPSQIHSKALFFPHLGFNEAHSTLPKTKGPSRFQTDLHDASVRHKRVSMATLTDPPQLWDAILQLCCSPKPFCCFSASWEAPHKLVNPHPTRLGARGDIF